MALLGNILLGRGFRPLARDDAYSIDENGEATVKPVENDSANHPLLPYQKLITSVDSGTFLGLVSISDDGKSLIFNPGTAYDYLSAGETATATLTYTMRNAWGTWDSAEITLTIVGENDGPAAQDVTGSVSEDGSTMVTALFTDPDAGDSHTFSVDDTATIGNVINNGDGTFTYDAAGAFDSLAEGETATDSFTYTVDDGHGGTDTATASITITGVNDAAVIGGDLGGAADETDAPVTLTGQLTATDVDNPDNSFVAQSNVAGTFGTFSIDAFGAWSFTANAAFDALAVGDSHSENFGVTSIDGTTSAVTITISGTNDAPVLMDATYTIQQQDSLTLPVDALVAALASDVDSDILTVSRLDGTLLGNDELLLTAGNGALEYSGSLGLITYTASSDTVFLAEGESETDSFTFTVVDEHGGESTATIDIVIEGVNDAVAFNTAPAAGGVTELTAYDINGGSATLSTSGTIGFTDLDRTDAHLLNVSADGAGYLGTFSASITSNDTASINGEVSWSFNVEDAALNAFTEGEVRTQTYTLTIEDPLGTVSTKTVTITLTGSNDVPWGYEDHVSTGENTPIMIDALANDGGPDADDIPQNLTITQITYANHGGTFSVVDNKIYFDPGTDFDFLAAGESGGISVRYVFEDQHHLQNEDHVFLTIHGENDAPVAKDDVAAILTPTSGDIQVNTTTSHQQNEATVTALSDGGFVVTWTSTHQDGHYRGINAQRFDANGVKQGAEIVVNTYYWEDQTHSSVAPLDDGGFVVIWQSPNQDGSGLGVYGQRFDNQGEKAGGEFMVHTFTDNNQFHPSVAPLADGGFVVTWTGPDQQFSDSYGLGIYAQRFDDQGMRVGPETEVPHELIRDQLHSSVATLTDGSFVVSWTYNTTGAADDEVYVRRFGADGEMLTYDILAHDSFEPFEQTLSSVAALADGGFVVTWQSRAERPWDGDGSANGIFGQRFDVDGNRVGSKFQVNTEANDDQTAPSVAGLPDGGFIVTWTSTNQDGSGLGVYGQLFDADGQKIGDETLINETVAGDQSSWLDNGAFATTVLSDGTIVSAFSGPQNNGDVFVRLFNSTLTDEDAVATLQSADLLANDSDVDNGSSLTIAGVSTTSALGAAVTLNSDGTISYDPRGSETLQMMQDGDSLTDSFTYTVSDGLGGTDTATVSLDVAGRGGAPIFGNGRFAQGMTFEENDIFGGPGDEQLFGGAYADTMFGGDGNDDFLPSDGNDVIFGGAGNDSVTAFAGDDSIWGGAGDDNINGQLDNDILYGGWGSDFYHGGSGADRFVMETGDPDLAETDTFNDFNANDGDRIISEIPGLAGVDDFFALASGDGADPTRVDDGDQLGDFAIASDGTDLTIFIGADAIIIRNTTSLGVDDFVFI